MHQQSGDIHHIVPKDYLQKNGYPDRGDYNQVANFALTETADQHQHQQQAAGAVHGGDRPDRSPQALILGEITESEDWQRNLAENAVPADLGEVTERRTASSSANAGG